jgi:hypothetical protein
MPVKVQKDAKIRVATKCAMQRNRLLTEYIIKHQMTVRRGSLDSLTPTPLCLKLFILSKLFE